MDNLFPNVPTTPPRTPLNPNAPDFIPSSPGLPVSNQIQSSLKSLLERQKKRNVKTTRLKQLVTEIKELIESIDKQFLVSGGNYDDIMKELQPILEELNTTSTTADTDIGDIENALVDIAKRLRNTLEKQKPPPAVLKGGYKHSRTSSRKYMVRRFSKKRGGKTKRGGKKTYKRRKK